MNEKLVAAVNMITEHLHSIVQELKVTESELQQAIQFLTDVGKTNEYPLFSDVLGISVAVDGITHGEEYDGATTEHNVLGPLYRGETPLQTFPVKLCSDDEEGDILFMYGQVRAAQSNEPLALSEIDVWQTNAHGDYENEDEKQPDYNLRGRFFTDENGGYEFRTVIPGGYEIGKGGPVGKLLKAIGRHAWRPAHIHFKISHQLCFPLTTMLFVPNAPWLDSDTINAVKESLIIKIQKHDDPEEIKQRGLDREFYTCHFDFILKKK